MEMPLAIDYLGFNTKKDKVSKGIFYGAWYRTLAEIYGLSRNQIEQRDKKREARTRKIRIRIVSGVIASLSLSLFWALISRQQAIDARKDAEIQRNVAVEQRKVANQKTEEAREQRKQAILNEQLAKDQEKIAKNNLQSAEQRGRRLEAIALAAQAEKLVARGVKDFTNWNAVGDGPSNRRSVTEPLENAYESVLITNKEDEGVTWQAHQALWNTLSVAPPLRSILRTSSELGGLAWSPDGRNIATGERSGNITLWETRNYRKVRSLSTGIHAPLQEIDALAFCADGKIAVNVVGNGGPSYVLLISLSSGMVRKTVIRYTKMSVSSSEENPYKYILNINKDNAKSIDCDPSGTKVVASDHSLCVLIDLQTGQLNPLECGPCGGRVSWSPSGKYVFSNGPTGIVIWDARRIKWLTSLSFDYGAWGRDDSLLVARAARKDPMGANKAISNGCAPEGQPPEGQQEGVETVLDLELEVGFIDHATGKFAVSRAKTINIEEQLTGKWYMPRAIAASPDLSVLATSYGECSSGSSGSSCLNLVIHVWNTHTGKLGKSAYGYGQAQDIMSWSPDGSAFISSNSATDLFSMEEDFAAYLWSLARDGLWNVDGWANALHPPVTTQRNADMLAAKWSYDGHTIIAVFPTCDAEVCKIQHKNLASVSWSSHSHQWDLNGWEWLPCKDEICYDAGFPVWRRNGKPQTASLKDFIASAISPDGRREMVWPNRDQLFPHWPNIEEDKNPFTVRVINRSAPEREVSLVGHRGWVFTAAWSPDGTKILTTGADNTIRIWDAATGEELVQYMQENVIKAMWRPDGKWILSVAEDGGGIKIWPVGLEEMLRQAHALFVAFTSKYKAKGTSDKTSLSSDNVALPASEPSDNSQHSE